WAVSVYTISYDLDGGISPGNPASYTVESNDIRLSRPTRMGYDFLGWSFEGIISLDVTIPHGSIGSREFKALWAVSVYAISYDLDGGISPGNPKSYTVESYDIRLSRPTRMGYDFLGWSFEGKISLDVTIPHGSIGSREFKALWAVHVYAISYDLDGGISPGNPKSYTVESNDIRLSHPTRTGYDFLGWSFDGEISLDVTIPHGSIGTREFKALWVAHKYEISYNLNGATAEGNPSSYTIETPAFTLNSPAKTGYTFTGWTGTSLDSPATAVTIPQGSYGNRSYTAHFTPITYSITYNLDGGTLPHENPESYDIESQTFTINIPTKQGFIFIGWTGSGFDEPEITVTIPQGSTGNRSYTAHYAEAQEDYPPEITADSFTLNAHKGQPATLIVSASSREIPHWTLVGNLPEGLTFTASDYSAEISGIPGAGTSGRYALNITASNSAGASSADILILIAGYSALSLDTHTTHTAFRDNSGNLILSADIAIIADSCDLTVEHGTLITIIASVDTALELYDSDYDTYIYSLDMAGLPHWLNVSGD
ncbi:MAG: InlB B-repeat-containing protein, partial [Synergistaceae bacterium]|nr:InlB B-repeat-containing protein [Synergistaceae bacterium]